jgi:putative transposase
VHAHLPRLPGESYRALAIVHWTLTVEKRSTGWLNDYFHQVWREVMVHTAARYAVACPVYCLMPDHAHVVWMGISPESEQQAALKFFRTHTAPHLAASKWQRQPFDHVLREPERSRDAFRTICDYVLVNPVRKGLVGDWKQWRYSGAIVAGYPRLDPRQDDFWDTYWKIYNLCVTNGRLAGE